LLISYIFDVTRSYILAIFISLLGKEQISYQILELIAGLSSSVCVMHRLSFHGFARSIGRSGLARVGLSLHKIIGNSML